jgi:hypothetical protein
MSVVTKLYFQIVEENNYMFWPFSGLAINRVETRISEKTHILQCGPKHVVVFFNNLKIQLCYDGHLYT